MKLRGNTIFYSLMISMIIAALLGGFLLVHSFQFAFIQPSYHTEIALENLLSSLTKELSQGLPSENIVLALDTPTDSVYLQTENWGLYKIVHGRGIHSGEVWQKSCLVGQSYEDSHLPSLFLTDQKQPLFICGKTRLNGSLYLPRNGIKSAQIGSRRFEYSSLYQGKTNLSERKQKPFDYQQINNLKKLLSKAINLASAKETYILQNAAIQQPWDSTIHLLQTPYSLEITSGSMKGKVLIISAGEITIYPEVNLEHTMIIARKIHLKSGVHGVLQAYATDSLIVDSSVYLGYPSALGLFKDREKSALLEIGKGSQIEGGIIFDVQAMAGTLHRNDQLKISKGVQVWGSVYASHNLELQGTVYGSVITDNFILQTPGTRYRNYLLDAVIDPSYLSPKFAGPIIYPGKSYKIIEWLESDIDKKLAIKP